MPKIKPPGIGIDIQGKHVYPGLINTNNILGLHDAEAVRATRDYSEIGNINPHIRSLIAYNAESKILETVKIVKESVNDLRSIIGRK